MGGSSSGCSPRPSEVLDRGAPDAACTYLERALAEPPAAQERNAVLFALGAAELIVLKPSAVDRLREAVEGAPDAPVASRRRGGARRGARVRRPRGGGRRAGQRAARHAPRGGRGGEAALRGMADRRRPVRAGLCAADAGAALGYEGRLRGETSGERLVLACLAFGAAHLGDSASATAEYARCAIGGGRLLRDHRPGSATYYLGVWALVYADRLEEAERWFDLIIEETRARGSMASFACADRAAAARSSSGRDGSPKRNPRRWACSAIPCTPRRARWCSRACWTRCASAPIRRRGAFLRRARNRRRPLGDGDGGHAAVLARTPAPRRRRRRAALHDFEQLQRRDELSGLDTPAMPSRASQALAHLPLGERDAARPLAEEELARARRWNTPSALAFALRTAGLVEGGAAGIELLRESVARVGEPPRRTSARARSPRSAPRCGAPAIAATRASRCARRSTSPIAAARCGSRPARARSSSPAAHGRGAPPAAAATR